MNAMSPQNEFVTFNLHTQPNGFRIAMEDFHMQSVLHGKFIILCFLMQIRLIVGYTTADVVYRWNQKRQVAIAEDMKLSQFDLVDCPAENVTDTVLHGDTANHSAHKTYVGKLTGNCFF